MVQTNFTCFVPPLHFVGSLLREIPPVELGNTWFSRPVHFCLQNLCFAFDSERKIPVSCWVVASSTIKTMLKVKLRRKTISREDYSLHFGVNTTQPGKRYFFYVWQFSAEQLWDFHPSQWKNASFMCVLIAPLSWAFGVKWEQVQPTDAQVCTPYKLNKGSSVSGTCLGFMLTVCGDVLPKVVWAVSVHGQHRPSRKRFVCGASPHGRQEGRVVNKAVFPMMECVTRWEIKTGETAWGETRVIRRKQDRGRGETRQWSIKKRQGQRRECIVVMLQTCCY